MKIISSNFFVLKFGCFFLVCILIVFIGCGRENTLRSSAPKPDSMEVASRNMEDAKYADAAEVLEDLLVSEPENYKARSLLAAANAALGGVTLFDFALRAMQNQSKGGSTGKGALAFFSVILPTPTTENIDFLAAAVECMELIPLESMTQDMTYQAGIFEAAYSFLLMTYYTSDPSRIAALSVSDATKILGSLGSSLQYFANGNSKLKPVLDGVSKVIDSISSAEGADTLEKLKSFLGNSVSLI